MNYKKIIFGSLLLAVNSFICLAILNSMNQHVVLACFVTSIPFCILYLWFFIKFFSSTFFFITFYLMLFYVQPIVYYLTEENYNYQLIHVKTMTFLVITFLHLFMIGGLFFASKKIHNPDVKIEFFNMKKATNLTLLITLFCVFLLFIDAGTLNILGLSRFELKNAGSRLRLIATYGLYLTSVLFFLVFFTIKKRSRFNLFIWIIFVVLFEVLIFLFFRTRSMMVVHLSSVVVGYYYSYCYYRGSVNKRLTKKVKSLFLVMIIGFLAIVTRFFRGFLQPSSHVSEFEFDWSVFLKESVETGDLGYSNIVLEVVSLVPTMYDHFYGQSYFRLLLIFIPRSIWPEKPINTETIVGGWLNPGVEGMSVPPGVAGDLYLNFGMIGVIFSVFFGMLFSLLDKKLTISNFMLWAVSATWIYHLVRGGFTNPIVIFIVLLVYIKIITKLYLHEGSTKSVQNISKFRFLLDKD
jgi:oligosaccharide repeat unit polymerase